MTSWGAIYQALGCNQKAVDDFNWKLHHYVEFRDNHPNMHPALFSIAEQHIAGRHLTEKQVRFALVLIQKYETRRTV